MHRLNPSRPVRSGHSLSLCRASLRGLGFWRQTGALAVLAGLLLAPVTQAASAQPLSGKRGGQGQFAQERGNGGQPAPIPNARGNSGAQPGFTANRPGQNQQHLAQWMDSHRNLPLDQQQRALEQEPGFHDLNPQVQQRMREHLSQLNNMSPEQRDKTLARTEAMERLQPAQRQQVRGALAAVGAIPNPDRRRAVAHAFYQLRDLPSAQRDAYMNSPQFRAQFNDQERGAINGLFGIAPIWPQLQGPQAQGPPMQGSQGGPQYQYQSPQMQGPLAPR